MMMNGAMADFPSTAPGSLGNPQAFDAHKRAVYRRAPNKFSVEILPPQRQGNAHAYGMRISPLISDTASIKTATTTATIPIATTEYTVWRRWEDCLSFQDTLEWEYKLRAKSKAQDLAAGKGVQKNGVYIRSDLASSFDSLPPGPDPNSIAKDVHSYLPSLNKKGTLFRASQTTVDRRHEEFTALILALFAPDLPALLREIRASRTIRDFFGFWRRDADLARKQEKLAAKANQQVCASKRGSGFSGYFAASTSSLHSPAWAFYPPVPPLVSSLDNNAPSRKPSQSSLLSFKSSRRRSSSSSLADMVPASAPPAPTITFSRSDSSSDSDLVSPESSSDGRMTDAHRLSAQSYTFSLVGDEEGHSSLSAPSSPWLGRRVRTLSNEKAKRVARIFETPPASPVLQSGFVSDHDDEEADVNGIYDAYSEDGEAEDVLGSLGRRASVGSRQRTTSLPVWGGSVDSTRSSWYTEANTTASSAASNMSSRPVSMATTVSVDLESEFPKPPDGYPALAWGSPRHSQESSDGGRRTPRPVTLLPSGTPQPVGATVRRSLSAGSNRPRVSFGDDIRDDVSVVDPYIHTASPIMDHGLSPITTPHKTPRRQRSLVEHNTSFHLPWTPARKQQAPMTPIQEPESPDFSRPSSMDSYASPPGSPNLSSPIAEDALVLKVASGDHIVLVRVPRSASLAAARDRIASKLAAQDAAPQTSVFALGLVPPPPAPATASQGRRPRSGSLSGAGDLRLIVDERAWEDAVNGSAGKLALRVIEVIE